MGKWQVSQERHEIPVRDRDGEESIVYVRELPEKDVRAKNAAMLQYNRKGGDAQSARIRIEKIREYEMNQSIVDWDFYTEEVEVDKQGNRVWEKEPVYGPDPAYSGFGGEDDAPEILLEEGVPKYKKLEVNTMTISLLPQYVSSQIHKGILDLNDLPTDTGDDDDEDYEENPI